MVNRWRAGIFAKDRPRSENDMVRGYEIDKDKYAGDRRRAQRPAPEQSRDLISALRRAAEHSAPLL
jgi:hypothetical protein